MQQVALMSTESDGEVVGTLRQLRFRKLVRALYNNGAGVAQAQIADELGVSAGLISQIIIGNKHAGEETIDKAKRAWRIHEDFFSVDDISPYTTHLPFIGRSPLRNVEETRLERDELPGLTEYEEQAGPLDDRYRRSVIGLARSEGPDAITAEVVSRHVDTLRAIDRGKRVQRPRDPENVIDVKAGQQRAAARKKGKR